MDEGRRRATGGPAAEERGAGLRAAVLAALRAAEGRRVSGGELARRLGVSRTAVWKAVEALRREGFPIEGVPRGGYVLLDRSDAPRSVDGGAGGGTEVGRTLFSEAKFASLLRTRVLGRVRRVFSEVPSTQDEAKRWAQEGAPHGALVLADAQTRGRGRHGRRWVTVPGRTLSFTLVLRYPLPLAEIPPLALTAAVALAETVVSFGGVPTLKWPNDLVLDGRKAGGILLEVEGEAERASWVLLGIGVNIGDISREIPPDLRPVVHSIAAHLAARGKEAPGREKFLAVLLEHLEVRLDEYVHEGFVSARRAFLSYAHPFRGAIRVKTTHGVVAGRMVGVGPRGELLLLPEDNPAKGANTHALLTLSAAEILGEV
ncbi:BirA family biotin operon repressor/biotin-[acetyl-CoA-carboxylase] ligase [Brockia lithotrophica]|uniref:Bifunctional ligase/repressor BirA n=1 Tax=Brockia lithotrophica TaxID=933949 RepID=A0A660L6F2_9BACL|nr:BirA family biotin operon repressor/biotin-[acetyl-CoA-carboxylase] ligase [Brockia lithotrophica]